MKPNAELLAFIDTIAADAKAALPSGRRSDVDATLALKAWAKTEVLFRDIAPFGDSLKALLNTAS